MKFTAFVAVCGLASPAIAAVPVENQAEAALDRLKESNTANVGWAEVPSIWQSHFRLQKARWFETMRVEYSVSKTGRIINCAVMETSGSSAFDNAACGALARVRDLPVTRDANGRAMRSHGKLDYKLFYGPAWICATGLDEPEE
jgi:TonB family protein